MGSWTSRQNARQDEQDAAAVHQYRYPPKSGYYFASHFIMGGERFDAPQPEAYLFGENSDLNFLGQRPTPFPYPPPQVNEPTKTLKCRVNVRKESLRMVKAPVPGGKGEDGGKALYNLEFMLDCECDVSITVYYLATEEITPNGVVFTSKDPSLNSDTYRYSAGANQLFLEPGHTLDPSRFHDEQLSYSAEREVVPVAIHCVTSDAPDLTRQCHTTVASIERHSDGTYVLKPLKQKIFMDGLSYLLQEIYGIENKNQEKSVKSVSEVEGEDNGAECVICMSDIRDTLILPCRHLCLCNACADSLRYQANNCPICRSPFRALLQIRALRKSCDGSGGDCDNVPPGYEAVSLIEALNGPYLRPTSGDSLKSSRKSVGSCASSVADSTHTGHQPSSPQDSAKESSVLFVKRKSRDIVTKVDETSPQDEPEEEVDSEAEKYSPLLSGGSHKYRASVGGSTGNSKQQDKSRSSTDSSASSTTNLQHKASHGSPTSSQ